MLYRVIAVYGESCIEIASSPSSLLFFIAPILFSMNSESFITVTGADNDWLVESLAKRAPEMTPI